jgi:hypothetical protein
MSMKKLQLDGKHLTADIVAIIHKLGDPEQQELIHGEWVFTNHRSVAKECRLIKQTFNIFTSSVTFVKHAQK